MRLVHVALHMAGSTAVVGAAFMVMFSLTILMVPLTTTTSDITVRSSHDGYFTPVIRSDGDWHSDSNQGLISPTNPNLSYNTNDPKIIFSAWAWCLLMTLRPAITCLLMRHHAGKDWRRFVMLDLLLGLSPISVLCILYAIGNKFAPPEELYWQSTTTTPNQFVIFSDWRSALSAEKLARMEELCGTCNTYATISTTWISTIMFTAAYITAILPTIWVTWWHNSIFHYDPNFWAPLKKLKCSFGTNAPSPQVNAEGIEMKPEVPPPPPSPPSSPVPV